MRGSSSVVKLLGGRGAIVVVSSRRLMALYILLMWFVVACTRALYAGFKLGDQIWLERVMALLQKWHCVLHLVVSSWLHWPFMAGGTAAK